MGKLSDTQLRNWIQAGKPLAKSDGDGLTFTLSAKGTAAWVLRYRYAGRPRELTLGRYPEITLKQARELGMKHRASIMKGLDAGREVQRQKAEQVATGTVRALTEDYMAKRFPKLAPATVTQRRYHIERWILPRLGSVGARDLGTSDIVALIEHVGRVSTPHIAEIVHTALSEIYKHGMHRHWVTSNPCKGLSVRAITGDPAPTRERLQLRPDELKVLLPALSTMDEQQNALIVRLLLLTCVRINELMSARWQDVDLAQGLWVIPDERSKTRRGFTVPLVPAAVQCFEQLKVLACNSPFVVPGRLGRRDANGQQTFAVRFKVNAAIDRLIARLDGKVRRFTPHDLRSTARSYLTQLGVDLIVAEKCLNHRLGGLLEVYDKSEYLPERRQALTTWAEFLNRCEQGLIDPPSRAVVVPLRSQAIEVAA